MTETREAYALTVAPADALPDVSNYGFRFHENGLELKVKTLTTEQFKCAGFTLGVYGKQVGRLARAWQLAFGDWMNYGFGIFGEDAAQHIGDALDGEFLAYDPDTLTGYKTVAERIAPTLRRGELEYSHFKEIAYGVEKPEERAGWVELAAKQHLTVRELRDAIKAAKAQDEPISDPEDSGAEDSETEASGIVVSFCLDAFFILRWPFIILLCSTARSFVLSDFSTFATSARLMVYQWVRSNDRVLRSPRDSTSFFLMSVSKARCIVAVLQNGKCPVFHSLKLMWTYFLPSTILPIAGFCNTQCNCWRAIASLRPIAIAKLGWTWSDGSSNRNLLTFHCPLVPPILTVLLIVSAVLPLLCLAEPCPAPPYLTEPCRALRRPAKPRRAWKTKERLVSLTTGCVDS